MKINKQKVMLYEAFNDGMRVYIRKDNLRKIEDIHILLNAKNRLATEFRKKYKEIEKTINDMYKKYKLNDKEQKYYDENVRNKK